MKIILNPEFNLDNNEIIKMLSKNKKVKPISKKMQILIDQMKEKALTLIEPKAMYKLFDKSELPSSIPFVDIEKVAFAICTLGPGVNEEINQLTSNGKLSQVVVLDAIASVAVESIAGNINSKINELGTNLGYQFSERYSPGYCDWDVSNQEIIFSFLDGKKIGVTLTKSTLMIPLKSISFGVNFSHNMKENQWELRCLTCGKDNCSYKRG